MRRFDAAGMCSAGQAHAARGAAVRAQERNNDNEERMLSKMMQIRVLKERTVWEIAVSTDRE